MAQVPSPRAAKTIYWFSYYVFLAALLMLCFPQALLGYMSLPPGQAGWVRVLGLVTLIVGFYTGTVGAPGQPSSSGPPWSDERQPCCYLPCWPCWG